MIRLLMACAVAYSLLPANMAIQSATQLQSTPQSGITAQDTLSAVQSTVGDMMRFCDRNVETCLTAKALATEAKQKAMQTLSALGKTENDNVKDENASIVKEETTSQNSQ